MEDAVVRLNVSHVQVVKYHFHGICGVLLPIDRHGERHLRRGGKSRGDAQQHSARFVRRTHFVGGIGVAEATQETAKATSCVEARAVNGSQSPTRAWTAHRARRGHPNAIESKLHAVFGVIFAIQRHFEHDNRHVVCGRVALHRRWRRRRRGSDRAGNSDGTKAAHRVRTAGEVGAVHRDERPTDMRATIDAQV